MSRYISGNEIVDKARNFSLPQNNRGIGTLSLSEDFGNIKMDYFNTGKGITLTVWNSFFYEDLIFYDSEKKDNNSISFLSFNLGENQTVKHLKEQKEVEFTSNTCLNGKVYGWVNAETLRSKNKRYSACHISFDNNLYDNLLGNKKQNELFRNDSISVYINNYMGNKQKVLLQEILNAPFKDELLQEIYLESKLLDLIHTSAIINEPIKKSNEIGIPLSNKDIESLNRAKNLLIKNIKNPPSLKELAYKSAINEFKLKKGFKKYFGITVYGFLQQLRLEEAERLLKKGDINISEASDFVGYKHHGYFSKIFKEKFGILPIELKKEQKKIYI